MEFQLKERSPKNFAYEYKQDGECIAEIEWVLRDDVMHMTHTFVSNQLRGQGVAKKLLDQAAQLAREKNYKMKPICSYVVTAFEKSNNYDDIKS